MAECNRCGQKGLTWQEANTKSGWQLYNPQAEIFHKCQRKNPKDIGDPIIDNINKTYYKNLGYFLRNGYSDKKWIAQKEREQIKIKELQMERIKERLQQHPILEKVPTTITRRSN